MLAAHDIRQPLQFLPTPYTSGRVVGVTQQEHIGILGFRFHVLPVDLKTVIDQYQRRSHQLTTHILYAREETVVRRRESHNFQRRTFQVIFPVHRAILLHAHLQRRKNSGDSRYHSRCIKQIRVVDALPAVPTLKPGIHRIVVRLRHDRVTENTMIQPALHRVTNRFGGFKIHIGYPQRQTALRTF